MEMECTTELQGESADLHVTFKCEICRKSFKSYLNSQTSHMCELCEKNFNVHAVEASDSEETRISTTEEEHKQETNSSDKTSYKCGVCEECFVKEDQLMEHSQQHTKVEEYKCEVCQRSFSSKTRLQYHTKKNKRAYKCEICRKMFHNNTKLILHLKGHAGPESSMCNICGKLDIKRNNMDRHMRTHTIGIKKADTCRKTLHTVEKMHRCKVCGIVFDKQHLLADHLNTHNYDCHICVKSFSTVEKWKRHQFYHKQEGSFICELCGKSYIRKASLKHHLKAHARNKLKEEALNKRIQKESNGTFKCKVCGHMFLSKSLVAKHMKKKHRGEINC